MQNKPTLLETGINEQISDQPPTSHQNEYEPLLTMHILNGFLVALGLAAVAIALTVLSSPTIGILGICIASVGALSITAGGFGFFHSHCPSISPTNMLS